MNGDGEKGEDSKTCRKWLIEKGKKEGNNGIEMEKWEKYFRKAERSRRESKERGKRRDGS